MQLLWCYDATLQSPIRPLRTAPSRDTQEVQNNKQKRGASGIVTGRVAGTIMPSARVVYWGLQGLRHTINQMKGWESCHMSPSMQKMF